MMRNSFRHALSAFLGFPFIVTLTYGQPDSYPGPASINRSLRSLQNSNAQVSSVKGLASSPGGREVLLMEIGREVSSTEKTNPAILVVGNLEGDRPLASLAALRLAERILEDPGLYEHRTWYIVPAGNPDAFQGYSGNPRYERTRNAQAWNDDADELTDEDWCNDLNGDGLITRMRVEHPAGEWIPVTDEPRLMRKADPNKGERGIYRLYDEGTDIDGDGQYNEDGAGGTNVNLNFPHLFKFLDPESGLYPGSAPEARAIIEFAFGHPEIAMTFAFGATNFCHTPPRGGRKGEADLNRITIPDRFAEMMGADPGRTYSMQEIIEMVQPMVPPGVTVDESMVASFLGLGAVVNPLEQDLAFYNKLSEDYQKYLEEKGVKGERFEPARAKDGSFELWSYYHLGLPVFSMDLWSVPKPEKEEAGPDPEEKALLDYSDRLLEGKGFVEWEKYDHPDLGSVEIGGFVPFLSTTPPLHLADSIMEIQLPWVFRLTEQLPSLKIHETAVIPKGPGVFHLEVWVENTAYLPFPTAMGKRNEQPAPAIVLLEGEGFTLLSGYDRTPLEELGGFSRRKLTWLVRAERDTELTIRLTSKQAGNDETNVRLGS